MLATLEAKLIALGAVLLLLLGAYAWAHHQGAESQKAADAKIIAVKDQALDAANVSLQNAATALGAASAAAKANEAQADAAKAQADAAKAQADAAKRAVVTANAAWAAKFKAAQSDAGCATLKEQLCPSVMGY